jgi:hypothetical protein
MDETNLLSLIRPWLNNIYQITTKVLQYHFVKKIASKPALSMRRGAKKNKKVILQQQIGYCSVTGGTVHNGVGGCSYPGGTVDE